MKNLNLNNKIFYITRRISHIYTMKKKSNRFTLRVEYLPNNTGFILHEFYPNNIVNIKLENINKK